MARYNGMGWHNQSIRHSNARKYGKAGGYYAVMRNSDWSAKIIKTNKIPTKKDFPKSSFAEGKYKTKKEAINRANQLGYKVKKHFGQSEREYGFDLTSFKSAEDFKELLKANGLTKYKKVRHYYGNEEHYDVFSWSNSDGTLELRTGNNPITGEYNQPKMRKNEKGYASYMGIKGDNDKVERLADDIKRRATEIKDEDPKHNGFIW